MEGHRKGMGYAIERHGGAAQDAGLGCARRPGCEKMAGGVGGVGGAHDGAPGRKEVW